MKEKSWSKISNIGKMIKRWKKISRLNDVPLEISGLDAMPKFEIKHKKNDIYKQYIVAEMLKKNILAKNIIYLSVSHSKSKLTII